MTLSETLESAWKDGGLPEAGLTVCLTLALLFSQVSISLEEGFLALGLAAWVWLLARRKAAFSVPPFFWPLLAYAGLSLLASALSVNPGMSFKDSRELLLFLAVPLTLAAFKTPRQIGLATGALLVSAFANGLYSAAFQVLEAEPGQRIKGFMGHYMTQAGLLAVFAAFALGLVFFGKGKRRILWAAGTGLASLALLLTLTRSAWIGLAVAACLVMALWRPKFLILVPVLAGLVYLAGPPALKNRIESIFSLGGYSNMERVQYAKAGLAIIAENPLDGTGPDTVDMVFQNPKYGLGQLAKSNVHLHSNPLQIGAERGLPALAAWLAFVGLAFAGLWRKARRTADGGRDPLAVGGLAALAAFFVAGLMEYNFGDGEILTLLLVALSLPYASSPEREAPQGP